MIWVIISVPPLTSILYKYTVLINTFVLTGFGYRRGNADWGPHDQNQRPSTGDSHWIQQEWVEKFIYHLEQLLITWLHSHITSFPSSHVIYHQHLIICILILYNVYSVTDISVQVTLFKHILNGKWYMTIKVQYTTISVINVENIVVHFT